MWQQQSSPETTPRPRQADALEAKRKVLAAVDDLRGGGADSGAATETAAGNRGEAAAEMERLRRQLAAAESAKRFLEEEVLALEERALAAIAETGRLRRELDEAAELGGGLSEQAWRRERQDLRRHLEAARIERGLLTSALSDSESELARMARAIDLMARKLQVAS